MMRIRYDTLTTENFLNIWQGKRKQQLNNHTNQRLGFHFRSSFFCVLSLTIQPY